ncbi:MAG TPA: hypothetical protein VHY09_07175 [Candidatus Methylacidiphilales bacterium]|nr:hypothetical protein [Candidatus Methylacidiphilales bacterium]
MSYRLAYGLMIVLLLATFSLLMSLKMVPYWQTKYRFEPIALDGHSVAIAWADDGGSKEVGNIPVSATESFEFAFPWLNMQRQVEKSAVKVVVRAKLPEAAYVLKLTGKADTVTLPLDRQIDGTYSTPAFIALEAGDAGRYFHGVRVFHVRGDQCLLAVERVVSL